MQTIRLCSEPGCENLRVARGLCNKHYHRLRWETEPEYRENCRANEKKRDRKKANKKRRERWHGKDHTQKLERLCETQRKYRSGFAPELVEACRQFQQGKCAICNVILNILDKRSADGEHADHFEMLNGERVFVHRKNKNKDTIKHPRGLLCWQCNTALAIYENYQKRRGLLIDAYEAYLSNPPVSALIKAGLVP